MLEVRVLPPEPMEDYWKLEPDIKIIDIGYNYSPPISFKKEDNSYKVILEATDYAKNVKYYVWANSTYNTVKKVRNQLLHTLKPFNPQFAECHVVKDSEINYSKYVCYQTSAKEFVPVTVTGEVLLTFYEAFKATYNLESAPMGKLIKDAVVKPFSAMFYGGPAHMKIQSFDCKLEKVSVPTRINHSDEIKEHIYNLKYITILPYLQDEPVYVIDNELTFLYLQVQLNFILWLCMLFGD